MYSGEDRVYTRLDLNCLLGEKEEALAIFKEIPRKSYLTLLYHPYLELIRDAHELKLRLLKSKEAYEEKLSKYGNFRL